MENRQLEAYFTDEGPRVDGILDDPVWEAAIEGGELFQYEPRQGDPMSERTVFKVVYDRLNLYLAVWCFDSEPDGILAREMQRGRGLFSDDYIYFAIDTFHDQRNGYAFAFNANGAEYDGIFSNNANFNSLWDGIWDVETQRTSEGWFAEVRIPFKTLAYSPDSQVWGFNINRTIRRKNEFGRWTGFRPGVRTYYASEMGDLTGLDVGKTGLGLQVKPYIIGRAVKDRGRLLDWELEAGGDVRYELTPQIWGRLAYNIDFAETEVDDRIVNVGRFPLFFPERRDFFLEDATAYEFGGLGQNSFPGLRNLVIPYFSRRIGLNSDGSVLPIEFAFKMNGKRGPWSLAVTDAMVEDADGGKTRNLLAVRGTRQVFKQSSLGFLGTVGDPDSPDNSNFLAGPDFSFRSTQFLGNQIFEANAFGLVSGSDEPDLAFDGAYGANFSLPNDLYRANIKVMSVGSDFDPGMGFSRRTGVQALSSYWSYRPRPLELPAIRQFRFTYMNEYFLDQNWALASMEQTFFPVSINFNSGDELYTFYEREMDVVTSPFTIGDEVQVDEGEFWWNNYGVGLEYASRRVLSGETDFRFGQYYNGNRFGISNELDLRAWKHLGFGIDHSINRFEFPNESVDVHTVGSRLRMNFTTDLFWNHVIQFDTVSQNLGYNSRVVWEYIPGSRVFLVYNQAFERMDGGQFIRRDYDATLKLEATFRF